MCFGSRISKIALVIVLHYDPLEATYKLSNDLLEVKIRNYQFLLYFAVKINISTPMKQILTLCHFDLSEVIWRPVCSLHDFIIQNQYWFLNPWPKKLISWHLWSKNLHFLILTSHMPCGGQYVAYEKTNAILKSFTKKTLFWHSWSFWYFLILTSERPFGGQYVALERW